MKNIADMNMIVERIDRNHQDSCESRNRNTRMYFMIAAESLKENLDRRFDRPQDEYRKKLPAVFKQFEMPENTVVMWSQKAGCSCGCSPGFVLPEHRGFDIFVKLYENDMEMLSD